VGRLFQDKKVAYLQFMLEKDGKMEAFEKRIRDYPRENWKQIQTSRLSSTSFASRLAHEFYPEVFSDATAFQNCALTRPRRKMNAWGKCWSLSAGAPANPNIIFILDEVGQYIAARTT